jgi:SAM-dependent methyltransferase
MTTADSRRRCWCGAHLEATAINAASFRVLHCAACGTFAIDPPPLTSDEESGDFYTSYYASRASVGAAVEMPGPGRWSRYWRVVAQAPAVGAPDGLAIDFGSGDGRLCHELSEAGWQSVVGFDVSRARVARARRLYPTLRFFDRPIDESGLPVNKAGLCVMDNVIEHLTDPTRVLRQLKHYLGTHGRIVVITPNMESGHFRMLGRRWTPELAPHAHVFLFTTQSLTTALERSGFVVEQVGTFHDDPYPLKDWGRRLISGDIKGALWRAHQEMGALYGRLIGAGPMLFAIGAAPAPDQSS